MPACPAWLGLLHDLHSRRRQRLAGDYAVLRDGGGAAVVVAAEVECVDAHMAGLPGRHCCRKEGDSSAESDKGAPPAAAVDAEEEEPCTQAVAEPSAMA